MKSIFIKNLKITAFILLGCSAMALLLYTCLLIPQQKNKKMIENQLAEKKEAFANIKNLSQSNIAEKLRAEIEDITSMKNNFVAEPEIMNNLTFEIGQIADSLKINAFKIVLRKDGANDDQGKWKHIAEKHFAVSFQADYNQFANFLNSLERHKPVVFVDNFKIAKAGKDDEPADVRIGLTVLVKKSENL